MDETWSTHGEMRNAKDGKPETKSPPKERGVDGAIIIDH
jgi:hypothetical protein